MQDMHNRREAALTFHKEEFESTHSAYETKAAGEDEIDGAKYTS